MKQMIELAERRSFAFGDENWPGLAKLVEECGEVVQVVGKLMMTHGDPAHWSGDLRAMLVDEVADVCAASMFVMEHCFTDAEGRDCMERQRAKIRKFRGWHADMDADPPPPLRATAAMKKDDGE